jgi:hypothetical protein
MCLYAIKDMLLSFLAHMFWKTDLVYCWLAVLTVALLVMLLIGSYDCNSDCHIADGSHSYNIVGHIAEWKFWL